MLTLKTLPNSANWSRYWNGTYPPLLRGAVNAASNIGNIIGQVSFGFLGDTFGRKFVYGKETYHLHHWDYFSHQPTQQHPNPDFENGLDLLL